MALLKKAPSESGKKISIAKKFFSWNMTTFLFLVPGLIMFITLFVYPILITISTSLKTNDGSDQLTFSNYVDFLTKPEGWQILWLSFILAIVPTIIMVFLSVPFALLLRKKFRGHRFYRTLIILPLMIPSLISSLGLLLFYNSNGWFNLLINTFLPFLNGPIKINYTIPGLVIFYVWLYFPFSAISILSAVESLDSGIEEAARVCGASPLKVLWHILIPLIMPGIMSGSIMTFLLAFGSFSVPLIAGGDYRPIAVQVYTQSVVFRNWPKGSAIAIIMSILQVLFLIIYMRLGKRRRYA